MPGSPVADIRNSFGAAFVGLLVCIALWGMTIVQTWIYFWHYRNRDPKALKLFISFIGVVNTLNIILRVYAIYWYLVLNYGNVESLDYIMWALKSQVASGAIVGASVQLFYARRVYIVSQSIICTALIMVFVAIAFSSGFYFTVKEFTLERFSMLRSTSWAPCVGMVAITVADLLIAGAMCWSLYRKKTGFARTDSIIMTLMAYSINSGLLTSLLGAAAIISLLASPSSMIWLAILWAMAQCSVNSLLAMLNSRDHVLEQSSTNNPDNAFNLSSFRVAPPGEVYGSKSRQTGVSVIVHRSTASGFGQSKSDNNEGPTFEIKKVLGDTTIGPSQSQSRISESSAA